MNSQQPCPRCSQENPEGQAFCGHCGIALNRPAPPPPPQQPYPHPQPPPLTPEQRAAGSGWNQPPARGLSQKGCLIGTGAFLGFVILLAVIVKLGGNSVGTYTATTSTNSTPARATSAPPATPTPAARPGPTSSPGVTLTNFNRLRDGMTYEEAVRILGKEGTEISSTNVAGHKTVMYQWEGDGWGSNMNAMFQNGKLISKAQFGLK